MRFQPSLEVSGEFVGRSAEEAVERARKALGADARVRCWKTRRGGVLGFFAREVFVAGVNEPRGKIAVAERPLDQTAVMRAPRRSDSEVLPLGLDELVASTNDEVSCRAFDDDGSEQEFRDVLAQAEAALNDVAFDEPAWRADDTQDRMASECEPVRDEAEEFRDALGSLGLPAWYQPLEHESVLDGLAKSLRDLPPPAALPEAPGSIIAVVGSRREATEVGLEVAAYLELAESDVITLRDDPVVRRRIARRKNSTRVSVVIVDAPSRGRTLSLARESLSSLCADYVLGAVSATRKPSDVERWCGELGVSALAVRRWDHSTTPAELVTVRPILSVDGVMMSTLQWVSLLLATYLERNETA